MKEQGRRRRVEDNYLRLAGWRVRIRKPMEEWTEEEQFLRPPGEKTTLHMQFPDNGVREIASELPDEILEEILAKGADAQGNVRVGMILAIHAGVLTRPEFERFMRDAPTGNSLWATYVSYKNHKNSTEYNFVDFVGELLYGFPK